MVHLNGDVYSMFTRIDFSKLIYRRHNLHNQYILTQFNNNLDPIYGGGGGGEIANEGQIGL